MGIEVTAMQGFSTPAAAGDLWVEASRWRGGKVLRFRESRLSSRSRSSYFQNPMVVAVVAMRMVQVA